MTSTEQEGDPLADKEYDGALLHSSSPSVSAASSDNELAETQPALAGAAGPLHAELAAAVTPPAGEARQGP